ARGEGARAFRDHPHISRVGMHQGGLRVGDPPDVDVVASAFKHAQRLLVLAVHVAVVFLEGFERDADRLVGWSLLQDHGSAFPSLTLSRRLPQHKHGGKKRQSSKYAQNSHLLSPCLLRNGLAVLDVHHEKWSL